MLKKTMCLLAGSFFCLAAHAADLQSITVATSAGSDPLYFRFYDNVSNQPVWISTPVSAGQEGPAPSDVVKKLSGKTGLVFIQNAKNGTTFMCNNMSPVNYVGNLRFKGYLSSDPNDHSASCTVTAG